MKPVVGAASSGIFRNSRSQRFAGFPYFKGFYEVYGFHLPTDGNAETSW